MKNQNLILKTVFAVGLAAGLWSSSGIPVRAQTGAANPPALSPELQEVVKLSQQHINDDVIINYVSASGKNYKLSADDIISLNNQGVSQKVILALQTTPAANPNPIPAAVSPATNAEPPAIEPPPLETPPAVSPATPGSFVAAPMTVPGALQDNFCADTSLNPFVWQTKSDVLSELASMYSSHVLPALAFSSSGLQMSGPGAHGQFTGIQSAESFVAPFNFSVTVSGLEPGSIPFEIYLVSADLKQRLTITGHLGGGGGSRAEIDFATGVRPADGGIRVGTSAGYGLWINHTGSGIPISALGSRFYDNPLIGLPYTFQVYVGPDGNASVSLLDSAGHPLAAQNVAVGTGPFYVVLGQRNSGALAKWQSVQLTPASPPAVQQPAIAAVPTLDYFQSQLVPYGNWLNLPGYGICWQPAVDFGWRPYFDGGHWQYTDAGWYWQSDYTWGDLPFHYGRWAYTASGWVWVPGYDYAPAWVVWRHADADGFVGWAALPPGAVFVNGAWEFNHLHVAADFDFGLGVNFFNFVGYNHFWEPDFRRFVASREQVAVVFRHSIVENHYQFDHGRFINHGLPHDRMAALTHREIEVEVSHNLRAQEENRNSLARQDDNHNFKAGARPDARRFAETRPGGGYQSSPHPTRDSGRGANDSR